MPEHRIIVVGTSAGGVQALQTIVGGLPADFAASLFIVIHTLGSGISFMPEIISRAGPLPAIHPEDGEEMRHGSIYVAPPDRHMLLHDGRIRLLRGPRENRHRPAIDPLFRSAAETYRDRVIGVILTGMLDDGAAGLCEVKRNGGVAVVQKPDDALFPGMPNAAIKASSPQHVLPLSLIAGALTRLVGRSASKKGVEMAHSDSKNPGPEPSDVIVPGSEPEQGIPSAFTCPDCGGTLWEIDDGNLLRYRCRVGHAYASESMMTAHNDTLDEALWVALRVLEENASVARRLAEDARVRNNEGLAGLYEQRVIERMRHAQTIREVLVENGRGIQDTPA